MKESSSNKRFLPEIIDKIERFAAKPAYVFIVIAVAFFFHALALDVIGLVLFAVAGGLFLVVFDDPRPALAVILSTVFVVSTQNSNGQPGEEMYFFKPNVLIPLIVAGAFLFACMVIRCVKNRKSVFSMKFVLPLAVFAVTILLSGINDVHKYQYGRNLIFLLCQIGSYFGFYLIFSFIVGDTENMHDYIATLIAAIAVLNILEVLYVYFLNILPPFEFLPENWRRCMRGGDFCGSARLWKMYIVTGCGVSNTIGALLALTLPSIFYKIDNSDRWGWYAVLAFAVIATILITFSRTALAVAVVLFAILAVRTIIKTKDKRKRISFIAVVGAAFVAAIIALAVVVSVNPKILELFLPKNLVMWDRFELWEVGMGFFKESPVFGVGYAYPTANEYLIAHFNAKTSMFRALLHNFVVQSLASSGIVGTAGLFFAIGWIMTVLIKEKYDGKFYALSMLFAFAVFTLFDIMYGVPYYVMFPMLTMAIAEKSIGKNEDKKGASNNGLCVSDKVVGQ